jgi:nitroreductase
MNTKLNFIFTRRSIRKFQEKPVPRTLLSDLLEAAMAAPSAVAKDPWHFIVLDHKEGLLKLADVLPNGAMLRQAAAAFVVVGDIEKAHDKALSFMLQDLSAAVENTLLAAAALGLGACWLGIHPRQERMDGVRRLYQLPENIIPVAGIAIGWPGEQKEARTRFKPELVHFGSW